MTTPLIKSLSREVLVAGAAYRVTIAVDRLVVTRKGARKGIELSWDDILSFDQHARAPSAPAGDVADAAGALGALAC